MIIVLGLSWIAFDENTNLPRHNSHEDIWFGTLFPLEDETSIADVVGPRKDKDIAEKFCSRYSVYFLTLFLSSD